MLKSVCHALIQMKERPADRVAVRTANRGLWKNLSWADYYKMIESAGGGVLSLGLMPGDRAAILSNTRLEWAVADLAILSVGGITVPIYQSNTPEDITYILNNSESQILFLENKSQFKKWQQISAQCPHIKSVISFDRLAEDDLAKTQGDIVYLNWDDFQKKGSTFLLNHNIKFVNLCEKVSSDQIATILYTSGTTGTPKGVVLTHTQILSEVTEAFSLLQVSEQDTSLTFLPYSHILGRIEVWAHVIFGYTMGYAESIERIKDNLPTIRPTMMVAVPRIFEKIYGGITTQMEASPTKKRIFDWALALGKKVSEYKQQGLPLPLPLVAQYYLAQKLIFSKIHEKMGGQLKYCISGGAALNPKIAEFFHACGLLLLEGYGLTETTAAVCVNTPFSYRFGSVGKPIGDVEIRIAEDGEILIRSKKVMREYYLDPEATKNAFTDGFFKTGDIGHLTEDGFLVITDRKKDLIKTAGGKYVPPQKIEVLLKASPYVNYVHIHGDQRKYVVALISPAFDHLKKFCREKGIDETDRSTMVKHPEVHKLFKSIITSVNSHLASYETVKSFLIMPNEFTVETGEITPSLKLKRKFCDQKYTKEIESLYV